MTEAFSAAELYADYKDTLDLTWLDGDPHGGRRLEADPARRSFACLVCYWNALRACDIPVVGSVEWQYLDALSAAAREEVRAGLNACPPVCIIIGDNRSVPSALQDMPLPILGSSLSADTVIDRLRHGLPERLSAAIVLHGVFMEIFGQGVLITGPSGVGKSELALASLRRGHRLVADDAPEFIGYEPETVHGRCPALLWGLLEVRDLGVVNVAAMFGYGALKRKQHLDLIVRLEAVEAVSYSGKARLYGTRGSRRILDVEIPEVVLHPGSQRDLCTMFETAVKNLQLARHGCPSGADLIDGRAGIYV